MQREIVMTNSTRLNVLFIAVLAAMVSPATMALDKGLYVTAKIGQTSGSVKKHDDYVEAGIFHTNTEQRYGLLGMTYGLGLGYNLQLNKQFYLGAELFANKSTLSGEVTHTSATSPLQFHQNYSYGLSLLPTWAVDPHNSIYLRLGVVDSAFTFENSSMVLEGPTFKHKHRLGWQAGVGMLNQLTQHWSLGMEYIYSHYQKLHAHNSTDRYSMSFNTNQFNLLTRYSFNSDKVFNNLSQTHWQPTGAFVAVAGGLNNSTVNEHYQSGATEYHRPRGLTGVVGSLAAGYRWQLGHWLIGPSIAEQITNSKMDYASTGTNVNNYFTIKIKNSLIAAANIGYLLNKNNLVNISIGGAQTIVEKDGSEAGPEYKRATWGWHFAAKYELGLSQHWSAFTGVEFTQYNPVSTEDGTDTYHYKAKTSNYLLGTSYTF